MKLRDYQQQAIDTALELFFIKNHLLFVLPCASGKTFIIAEFINTVLKLKPDFKCCFVIDDVRLIQQTAEVMPFAGVYCASLNRKEIKNITIASIQSMKNADFPDFDCWVRDEVHTITRYEEIFYKDKKLIGLTATPYKVNKPIYGEDKLFNEIDFIRTIKQMTKDKYIVPLVHQDVECKTPLAGIKITAGDYNQKDIAGVFDHKKLHEIVNNALDKSKNRNSIMWAVVNIESAEFLSSVLPDSVLLHSGLNHKVQDSAIKQFKSGSVRHIISVMQLAKGFNSTNADCLVLIRPTRSYSLYIQFAGRVLRLHPGKTDALLLDYGGVVESLGTIYDEFKPNEKPPTPLLCPLCMTFLERGTVSCGCGFVFPVILREIERGEVDYFKNLTATAFSKLKKITRISVNKYTPRSGKVCLKVMYWESNRPHHTDYIQPHKYKSFIKWNFLTARVPKDMDDVIKIAGESIIRVMAIETKPKGKYREISKRIIRER